MIAGDVTFQMSFGIVKYETIRRQEISTRDVTGLHKTRNLWLLPGAVGDTVRIAEEPFFLARLAGRRDLDLAVVAWHGKENHAVSQGRRINFVEREKCETGSAAA